MPASSGCPYPGGGGMTADPCDAYLRLRDDEPVRWDEDLELWFVTGFAEATEVLRHPAMSSTWPDHGQTPLHAAGGHDGARTSELIRKWFMFNDDPQHGRARRLVAPLLSADRITALTPFVEEQVEQLVSGDRKTLDVMSELAIPLSGRVICRVLGLPADVAPRLESWALDLAALLVADYLPDVVARGHATLREMTEMLDRALETELPTGSGLHRLRGEHRAGRIDRDEVWATATLLVYAGFETTSTFIGKAVRSLLHTGAWSQLQYGGVEHAVEELLRFDTSVQQLARLATDTVEIAGRRIAAGDLVLVMLGTANRDGRVFEEPDALDEGRRMRRHLAFGHGAHYCLGAGLARLESRVALTALRRKWSELRFAEPPKIRTHFGITVLESMRVRPGLVSSTALDG